MIIVRTTPGPFQVTFLVASLVGGATLAVAGRHLGSTLARALPPWVTLILAVGLITGSGVALAGMAVQRLSGLLAESVGLGQLALLFVTYSGFTVVYTGLRGVITVVFFVAFAGACVWRIIQIVRSVQDTRTAINARLSSQVEGA